MNIFGKIVLTVTENTNDCLKRWGLTAKGQKHFEVKEIAFSLMVLVITWVMELSNLTRVYALNRGVVLYINLLQQ